MNDYTICVRGCEFSVTFYEEEGYTWVCVWDPDDCGSAITVESCGRHNTWRSVDHFIGTMIGQYIWYEVWAM